MDRLSGITAFIHAAETGSFTAAAQRLHLTRSAVAKRVARLEERTGARLFHRTTRHLSLTEAGSAFYQRCVAALAEIEQAEEALHAGIDDIVGRLRISAPVELGRRFIAPVLIDLLDAHPRLCLTLSLSDRRVDLVEEGFDLAIRSGSLAAYPGLRARPFGQQAMVLTAAPSYLAAKGAPTTPADLSTHQALAYGQVGDQVEWHMSTADARSLTATLPTRLAMDDLAGLLAACEAGLGIARLPVWLVRGQLDGGTLVTVLPTVSQAAYPLSAVWPSSRQMPRKLRVVMDALAQTLQTQVAIEALR
ncbi:LysR family transcriptional regulator [Chitinimonas arctica]|uniref:LysR family transcriptional regulator n=1 Tax=Chitinimonas arctica TaxID=2594795 RepID=UPI001CC5588C|nr:LysR family transcriptional regulator [Chitinimonas arctica]